MIKFIDDSTLYNVTRKCVGQQRNVTERTLHTMLIMILYSMNKMCFLHILSKHINTNKALSESASANLLLPTADYVSDSVSSL